MLSLDGLLEHLGSTPDASPCDCRVEATDGVLTVDATACPGGGELAGEPACRERVVDALRTQPAGAVRVHRDGRERRYTAAATTILRRAARFAERVAHHDPRLADLATRDPLAAASEATQRAGRVSDLATATGLDEYATADDLADLLRFYEGPTIASARVATTPPPDGHLRDTYETACTRVRIYDAPAHPVPTYHVDPLEARFDDAAYHLLGAATDNLAGNRASGGARAHHAAVRAAAENLDHPDPPVDMVARVLRKHTAGYGVLADLFADPAVTDVYVNAPPDETVLRVLVDDQPMRTNVTLTGDGAATLASRVRAASGRPFSRAAPLVDAVATDLGDADAVRIAGTTTPVTEGTAFALRRVDEDPWRLADLVATGTLTPEAAAFLSLATARGRRLLVAGPRGAGKTTLLGALLWELPAADRVVVLEDTRELPVEALQAADRDALALRTATGAGDASVAPAEALRAALRLGDGALVVGEVRGKEATVLYEAMRVGANSSAVLGTIHGEDAASVEERVVTDLGVPRSSFAATDLVVTLDHTDAGRRLTGIEEVTSEGFATLYERTDTGLEPTPRIRRGNSRFVARLTRPDETYADVRDRLDARLDDFDDAWTGPGARRRTEGP